MALFNSDNPDAEDKMRQMLDPGHVDQQIRQAIQLCWMVLPAHRRNVAELEQQFRRLVDRALKDVREDSETFGLGQ